MIQITAKVYCEMDNFEKSSYNCLECHTVTENVIGYWFLVYFLQNKLYFFETCHGVFFDSEWDYLSVCQKTSS